MFGPSTVWPPVSQFASYDAGPSSPAASSDRSPPPCAVNVQGGANGIFSNLLGVACSLYIYGPHTHINLTNYLYRDVARQGGEAGDVWSQYLAPVSDCVTGPETPLQQPSGFQCRLQHWKHSPEVAMHQIMRRHFVLQPQLAAQVEHLQRELFGNHTLGVKIRATDRNRVVKEEMPRIPLQHTFEAIERYLRRHPETDAIFVASDNDAELRELRKAFGKRVRRGVQWLHIRRVPDGQSRNAMHYAYRRNGMSKTADTPFGLGRSALLDAWLLSLVKHLIDVGSNVSLFAMLLAGPKLSFTLLPEQLKGFAQYRKVFRDRDASKRGEYPALGSKPDADTGAVAPQTQPAHKESAESVVDPQAASELDRLRAKVQWLEEENRLLKARAELAFKLSLKGKRPGASTGSAEYEQ